MKLSNPHAPSLVDESAVVENAERMLQMILGSQLTQIMHAVAHFSIADELAKGPASASDIAQRCAIHPDATFRLLRACASLGLVTADSYMRFTGTPLLQLLRRDVPDSLRGLAIAQASPGHWLPWGHFIQAIETGQRQIVAALGEDIWEYYAKHPEESAAFTAAMTGLTARVSRDVAEVLDTRGVTLAADIGGASGALIQALLEVNPELRGVLFDLPDVVAGTRLAHPDMQERLSIVGGDFFSSVPSADVYLLKYILHDWDTDSCVRILENCRRAMRPGGRIVVIEQELGDLNQPSLTPRIDLTMLVMVTGRERTLFEYEELYAAAGLRLVKMTPIRGSMAVMEVMAK